MLHDFLWQILYHHAQLIQGPMHLPMYWQPLAVKWFVSIHRRVEGLYITHHAQNPAVTDSFPNSASLISDHKAVENIVGWHDWPSVLHLIYSVEGAGVISRNWIDMLFVCWMGIICCNSYKYPMIQGSFCVCTQPMRDDVTNVTSPPIGWIQTQNDPWLYWRKDFF